MRATNAKGMELFDVLNRMYEETMSRINTLMGIGEKFTERSTRGTMITRNVLEAEGENNAIDVAISIVEEAFMTGKQNEPDFLETLKKSLENGPMKIVERKMYHNDVDVRHEGLGELCGYSSVVTAINRIQYKSRND